MWWLSTVLITMQQPTATMTAPLPFGRRPSGSFTPDFPIGADPRHNGPPTYAPGHIHHQHNSFPQQTADLSTNYQYTSGRAPFDQQFAFDTASGSNIPSWFYNTTSSSNPPAQGTSDAGLPYQLESFAQHAPASVPTNLTGPAIPTLPSSAQQHGPVSANASVTFTSKSTPFSPNTTVPFNVGASGRIHPPSSSGAPHGLTAAVPASLEGRRASDESASGSAANLPLNGLGNAVGALPLQGHAHSAPESAGFNGSISPNSSARMSGSPEAINASQPYPAFNATATLPPGGMVMGAPVSASMLESIDSWLAPAPPAPASVITSNPRLPVSAPVMSASKPVPDIARNITPAGSSTASGQGPSSRASAGPAFHHGSVSNDSSTASGSVPFKTSIERRERNKASQRESRKRKQDRLETLESENVALRKALADMKKFSHALSNGAGIRGEDGAEVNPLQLTKFTGAFHLDLIESHLDDETAEDEWKGMIGHRFPAQTSQAQDWDVGIPGMASSTSDSDEENSRDDANGAARRSTSVKDEADETHLEKRKASSESSQTPSQQVKKAMWEISLNQKRQKAAQSFPSMVAVPELVLYKVCRLYFSTLLPFTTKLKSGIINLRAARETPGFIGGFDDFPRFPGDPSFGSTELYLPKNLMPTEMQMRIGFHPVEIAVLPYPAMRDRVLTILSAFHAIEELAQEEEDAARFTEDQGSNVSSSSQAGQEQQHGQQQQPGTEDPSVELTDADIRKRTAMVADMSTWKPKDFSGAVVMPDKGRVYSYGFLEKPRGSHRLRKPAQRWLDDFFYEVVQTLRVWSPAGDVFDGECFEFKESFFRKYPYMVDGEILRATNRWRRARGEDPIRL